MSFLAIALALIGISAIGSMIRIVIGPTVWDRLLGVGLVATKITLGVVIVGLSAPDTYIFDLALLLSILGFLATVLLSRFIERRGEL